MLTKLKLNAENHMLQVIEAPIPITALKPSYPGIVKDTVFTVTNGIKVNMSSG